MLRTNKACQYQVPNFGKSKRHNILYTADKCTVERDQSQIQAKGSEFQLSQFAKNIWQAGVQSKFRECRIGIS